MDKRKGIGIFLSVLMVLVYIGCIPSSAATKAKITKPQIVMVTQPKAEYTAGERVSLQVKAPNYRGKVQYRVILWDGNKKAQRELWPTMPGYYYTKWIPKGTQVFDIGWPINEPGAYSLTVLVKREGAKGSYDTFVKTKSFIVKAKDTIKSPITLSKPGETYGSDSITSIQEISNDIYIKANNVTLSNINVKGTVTVDPGKDGTAILQNVTASKINVLSGGENSIYLKSVKSNEMVVSSSSKVRIELSGTTVIGDTIVTANTVFDEKGGKIGTIIVVKDKNGKTEVTFRGSFTEPVIVEGDAVVNSAPGASIAKLLISPYSKDAAITLKGNFKSVEVTKEANIAADGIINNMELKAKANINTTENTNIEKMNKNDNDVTLTGSGTVNGQTVGSTAGSTGTTGNTPGGTTGGTPGGNTGGTPGGIPGGNPGTTTPAPDIVTAGVFLSDGRTVAATRTPNKNEFYVNLADVDDLIGAKTYFTTSKSCQMLFNGFTFNMTANTQMAFGPADFGLSDGDPPGISLYIMRSLYADSSGFVTDSVSLKDGSNPDVVFTLKIEVGKLKTSH